MLAFHQETGADVTVAARPVPAGGCLGSSACWRWIARAAWSRFDEKPPSPRRCPTTPSRALVSMGNYIFSRQPLVDALLADARRSTDHDFGRSIIPEMVPTGRVFAYDFQQNEVPGVKPYEEQAYWRDVGTVASYWEAHMDLLGESPRFDLDNRHWPIRTGITPGPPPASSGATSTTPRSANRRWSSAPPSATRSSAGHVWVNEGAVIEDSIVMDHTTVGKGARLRRAIVDRFNIIPADSEIGLDPGRRPPAALRRPLGPGGGAARWPARVPARPRGVLGDGWPPLVRSSIHGHFYQPPRENPWLEAVEVQDSAAPYHDWNERVTAECYAPNTAARRLDARQPHPRHRQQLREDLLQRRAHAARLARAPGPGRLRADPRGRPRERRGARGHGNAIAQVYNHMIMPLATRRDKVTQVRWGIEDFRTRFGREPEGMWLPETAVDNETLEVLAEAGLQLHHPRARPGAPRPAARRRGAGTDESAASASIRAAPISGAARAGSRWRCSSTTAPISRAIAFEDLLAAARRLVARLHAGLFGRAHVAAARALRDRRRVLRPPQPLRRHGAGRRRRADRGRGHREAHQLRRLPGRTPAHPRGRDPRADLVELRPRRRALAGRLRLPHPGRTRSSAGAAPLREALDWLRDRVDAFYEARASALLKDPWAARDAYVDVVLDREPSPARGVPRRPAGRARRRRARRGAAAARARAATGSSCTRRAVGSSTRSPGIEPVQILRYAAMALQYLRDLGRAALEDEFVRRLAAAPSNVPELGARRRGLPAPHRAGRGCRPPPRRHPLRDHRALRGLPRGADIYAYRVRRLDEARESYGGTTLRVGRVRVISEVTGEAREAMYAMLHFGGHDFTCAVRPWEDADRYDRHQERPPRPLLPLHRARHGPGHGSALPGRALLAEPSLPRRTPPRPRPRHPGRARHARGDVPEDLGGEPQARMLSAAAADAPIPEALALVGASRAGEQAAGGARRGSHARSHPPARVRAGPTRRLPSA